MGFLPRKRANRARGRIRKFPADDQAQDCHLTAFLCYKAGMTHVVRELDRPGSKMHKKEVVEAVSVIEAPPMIVVGMCGYAKTPRGLRCLTTVFAQHLPDQFKRAYYKNWTRAKKKAFTKYSKNLMGMCNATSRVRMCVCFHCHVPFPYFDGHFLLALTASHQIYLLSAEEKGQKYYQKDLNKMRKYASVIRVIAIGQAKLCRFGQKKANIMEIQINGGSIEQKVEFGLKLFESAIPVDAVFSQSDVVDAIGVTRGHGFEGVIGRWGVTKLPRKTHKGLRKVACIGAWHPSRVGYTVPRAGQHGYHHRIEANKKIYKMGKSIAVDKANARCETDLTDKAITPMGGFVRYGTVREDYLLIKGCVPGPPKRPLTLRKSLRAKTNKAYTEQVNVKFIDTSAKFGHGKFQTPEEKDKFMGPRKKTVLKNM